jgi:hopene-associated glycosyltransferase HpnB
MTLIFFCFATISSLGWLYLLLLRDLYWLPLLHAATVLPLKSWPTVDIIIPARNEASTLPQTLSSLLTQHYPGMWRIILVDDHSEDGTADRARHIASELNLSPRLSVISAPDLSSGWSGKLSAMQAGMVQGSSEYILFTDADIEHPQDSLKYLVSRAIEKNLDLVSLMVKLHCESVVEKLLIPPFVFFFMMLYPFRAVNSSQKSIAAAAGGVMLVRRQALDASGGLHAIKSALIDDCALAKLIKCPIGRGNPKRRIELLLTRNVKSTRVYKNIEEIWSMIARTAFTQLNYSPFLLVGTVIGMVILYMLPLFLIAMNSGPGILGLLSWMLMTIMFLPTILLYQLSWCWSLTLPLAAGIYTGATLASAWYYWIGRGGQWKGRAQA